MPHPMWLASAAPQIIESAHRAFQGSRACPLSYPIYARRFHCNETLYNDGAEPLRIPLLKTATRLTLFWFRKHVFYGSNGKKADAGNPLYDMIFYKKHVFYSANEQHRKVE